METTCEFSLEYTPSRRVWDVALVQHLRNCADCQEQTVVLGS